MGSFEIIIGISIGVLILINIGILVIGILLNTRGSPVYGAIINKETSEWSKSPII
jgi:hypothetical protein